jgi:hypothetical protein
VARRLALAVGLTLPAKMGWPVGSVVREVRVTGALAKEGLSGGETAEADGLVDDVLLRDAEGVAVADGGERGEREERRWGG